MNKRRLKSILAFLLCMVIFLQSGFGAWASETDDAVSAEGTEDEEAGQGDDQTGQWNVDIENEEESEEDEGQKDGEESESDTDFEEDEELLSYIRQAQEALENLAGEEILMALVYLCDSYDVKAAADFDGETVASIPSGAMTVIKGVEVDDDFNLWYQVAFEKGGTAFKGYILRDYLAYSNERFLEWEDTFFPKTAMFTATGGYPDIEQFPASYQDKLIRLKQTHPDWIFVRQNTKLDWSGVVKEECYKDRSLVHSSKGEAYRREQHSPGWYYASEQAVKYYLDPRNFLDEARIFQFEQLTYNPSYHSKSAVQNILKSTFMKGEVPGAGMSYADAFFQIGVSLKVSPFHLACRVYQEQGAGKSPLISGNYTEVPAYKGYYNYYNIGASGTTTKQVIESGLARAVKEGWNSHYASLKGGAGIIAKNYILRGQDTLYLQKFDVDGSDGTLFTHQYMQNISAPETESSMVRKAYVETGSLNNSFVFKIPVYDNMPSAACPVPGQSAATEKPTATPTLKPTATPTLKPTATPTLKPTATPTEKPAATPTLKPTAIPTLKPASTPTTKPAATSSSAPTWEPIPTETPAATATPTDKPAKPTETPQGRPTAKPTSTPVVKPAATEKPTALPTARPVQKPTAKPTTVPDNDSAATAAPTATVKSTAKPESTASPLVTTIPKVTPTAAPAAPTAAPEATPAQKPTAAPTATPGAASTQKPSAAPTAVPGSDNKPVTPAPANRPEQNENNAPDNNDGQNGNENQEQNNNNNSGQGGSGQQIPSVSAAPAGTADNPPAGSSENPPADAAGNTSSSGIRITAQTPKPHTLSDDREIVTMDMSKTGMIYAETLKQISEQGTEVVLKVSDNASWTIDGSEINTEEFSDIDLKVTLDDSRIPKDKLKILTENEQYVEMSLAHDGEFGFTMQLSVKLEDAEAGQYANLFYYNEETEAFEFMCASEISSTKEAVFAFTHASDYVIIISDNTKENLLAEKAEQFEQARIQEIETMALAKEETPAKEPVKAAAIIAIILLASAAVGIAVYLIVKRKDGE